MSRFPFIVLLVFPVLLASSRPALARERIVVGSKSFTESVVLGEIATHAIRGVGLAAEHRAELGGTQVLFRALERGDIDVYAEYTGTLIEEILDGIDAPTLDGIATELRRRGIRTTGPLGFNNSYAIGLKPGTAERLGVRKISDLAAHADLRLGLTNEFMDRGDGWPSLRQAYRLPQADVRGLDHDLAYRALAADEIDAMDVYTTDAEIGYYGLTVLEDDLGFFRTYHAIFLFRSDLRERAPAVETVLRRFENAIDEASIGSLNARVKLDGRAESAVAAGFVAEALGFEVFAGESTLSERLWRRTKEHLFLVCVAMAAGIVVAIPLGLVAARRPRLGQAILAVVGIIQTIPALALLVFMIPVLGIYEPPAIAALFLYSLLPMVRNTVTGVRGIPRPLTESALALGLSPTFRLLRIELPLASPSILAGVKTSAVITVGFATLGALIGAGGYGQPIFTGIRLDDVSLVLEGAVPSALLAVAVQLLLGAVERRVVPRGLRLG